MVGAGGGGGRRVRFAMVALSFFSVALALSLASSKIVLVVSAMALLIEVTVAVEAATGVQRLAIHNVGLREASMTDLVSSCNRSRHGDMALCGKGQERWRGGLAVSAVGG